MEEIVSAFPLFKLRNGKFLLLEVMMFIEYQDAYKFMFAVNKEGKSYILNNFITIRNGFINDGLIPFIFKGDFDEIL